MRQIGEELVFDFRSYGHHGRVDRTALTPAQARLVARTAARTPEVMVKVLASGACSAKAVARHLAYVSRKGEVGLHSDDGEVLTGKSIAEKLPEDWDLDLAETGAGKRLGKGTRYTPPRLVHKLVFSMPTGTPPDKVLTAVGNLCREEFALRHRYVMALHTDEPHPHVHLILKATSEQGERLNIKKAHLKEWRMKFAAHLRELGVPANATPRQFRGQMVRSQSLKAYWRDRQQKAYASRESALVRSVSR